MITGLSVVDVATELRELKEEYAEAWHPEKVLFQVFVEPGNESFEDNLAKTREITGKLADDKASDAKCLRLTEAAEQCSEELNVPWDQFYKAVGRGRSEKTLFLTFADDRITGGLMDTRFTVEKIAYLEDQCAVEIVLSEVDAADFWL